MYYSDLRLLFFVSLQYCISHHFRKRIIYFVLCVSFFLLLLLLLSTLFLRIYVVDNGDYDEKEQPLVTTEDCNRVLMSSCSLKRKYDEEEIRMNERTNGISSVFSRSLTQCLGKILNG